MYMYRFQKLAEIDTKILYLVLCHIYHMYYIGECANHQSDDNIQKTCTDVHLFL